MTLSRSAYVSWPPSTWPQLDQELIRVNHQQISDPFAESSPANVWAPSTQRKVVTSYGSWIAFVATAMPDQLDLSPADRIRPETVHEWLGTIGHLAPNSVVTRIVCLLTVARIADPSRDWSWLRSALCHLRKMAHGVRGKAVIPPPEILNLGITLMDQVADGQWRRIKSGTLTAFGQIRDGLILALWSSTALRRGEFSTLRIGHNLLLSPESARIEIPARQRKRTSVGLSIPIPDSLFPYLTDYLGRRAALRYSACHNGLWVNSLGQPLYFQGIARALGMRTKAAFGVPLPPHALRYSAATWIALNDPTHIHTAMSVLGHARLATTSKSYIMAQMVAAQRLVIANLRRLRKP